tara:strand:+ start:109 stop:357 length:249 start_codon:yes stop_codon:yes gene_type:complete
MYKMKQDQMLMLVVAFLFGLFFKQISGSVCGGREVEGFGWFGDLVGGFSCGAACYGTGDGGGACMSPCNKCCGGTCAKTCPL